MPGYNVRRVAIFVAITRAPRDSSFHLFEKPTSSTTVPINRCYETRSGVLRVCTRCSTDRGNTNCPITFRATNDRIFSLLYNEIVRYLTDWIASVVCTQLVQLTEEFTINDTWTLREKENFESKIYVQSKFTTIVMDFLYSNSCFFFFFLKERKYPS